MPLPQNVVGPLTSLVVSLINLQSPPSRDYPKRYYSTLFRELPARELYPDYYIFIKEPRSLNGIMVSTRMRYKSCRVRESWALEQMAQCAVEEPLGDERDEPSGSAKLLLLLLGREATAYAPTVPIARPALETLFEA